MRDGIQSRAQRLARALARRREGSAGLRYRRVATRVVGHDGTPLTGLGNWDAGTFGDVEGDDVLRIKFRAIDSGQFLPNPQLVCDDGTPIPYDVLDKVGIGMFREMHSAGGVGPVFFDKDQSEGFADEQRKWLRSVNPSPEFQVPLAEDDEVSQGRLRDVSVASLEDERDPPLPPELDAELREFRDMNPIKKFAGKVYDGVEKWLPKEPQSARRVVMPPDAGTKRKAKVADGPPPGTAWAKMIEANKAKRAEREAQKLVYLDEQRELDARLKRETRVTDWLVAHLMRQRRG